MPRKEKLERLSFPQCAMITQTDKQCRFKVVNKETIFCVQHKDLLYTNEDINELFNLIIYSIYTSKLNSSLIENCKTCCGNCNYMKKTYDLDKFKIKLKEIFFYRISKSKEKYKKEKESYISKHGGGEIGEKAWREYNKIKKQKHRSKVLNANKHLKEPKVKKALTQTEKNKNRDAKGIDILGEDKYKRYKVLQATLSRQKNTLKAYGIKYGDKHDKYIAMFNKINENKDELSKLQREYDKGK